MLTFFLWLGLVGAIMAATGTIGYRIYSNKITEENNKIASNERKEIKETVESKQQKSNSLNQNKKQNSINSDKRLVTFADNVEKYPNLFLLTFEAAKPWFPSGSLTGDSNPNDLSELIRKYDERDLEAIRKYALDHPEAPLIGWIFLWCTDDGKTIRSASFTEESYKKNSIHPYKYSVLTGDIFGYDPDHKGSEIKFARAVMEETWGEADHFDVAISFASEQRDMQAISTQVVGEDELIDELLVAPLSCNYTGFLYNMEETDSVFVEELSIVFPIVNF